MARLARLELSDEEVHRFQGELSVILDYMDMLSGVSVEGVEPVVCVHGATNAFREDIPVESMGTDSAIANAKAVCGDAFDVPLVVEDE